MIQKELAVLSTSNHNFRHNFRHAKTFFKKIHSRGKHSKHYTSRVLYIPFYSPNSPIFGAKLAQCRRYGITIIYRGTNNIRYTITTDRAQLGDRCAFLFYARVSSSEWGLFGHIARSAFRRTPSGREVVA